MGFISLPAYSLGVFRRFVGPSNEYLPYSSASAAKILQAMLYIGLVFIFDCYVEFTPLDRALNLFLNITIIGIGIYLLFDSIHDPFLISPICQIIEPSIIAHIIYCELLVLCFQYFNDSFNATAFHALFYGGNICIPIIFATHKIIMFVKANNTIKSSEFIDAEKLTKRELFYIFRSPLSRKYPEKFRMEMLFDINKRFISDFIEMQAIYFFVEINLNNCNISETIAYVFERSKTNTNRIFWILRLLNILSILTKSSTVNENQILNDMAVEEMLAPCYDHLNHIWIATLYRDSNIFLRHAYGLATKIVSYSAFFEQKRKSVHAYKKFIETFTFDKQIEARNSRQHSRASEEFESICILSDNDDNDDSEIPEIMTYQNQRWVKRQKCSYFTIITFYAFVLIYIISAHINIIYTGYDLFASISTYSDTSVGLSNIITIQRAVISSFFENNPDINTTIEEYEKQALQTNYLKDNNLTTEVEIFTNFSKRMANTPLESLLLNTADTDLFSDAGIFITQFVAQLEFAIKRIIEKVEMTVRRTMKVVLSVLLVSLPCMIVCTSSIIASTAHYSRILTDLGQKMVSIDRTEAIENLLDARSHLSDGRLFAPASPSRRMGPGIIIGFIVSFPVYFALCVLLAFFVQRIGSTILASQNFNMVTTFYISQIYLLPVAITDSVPKQVADIIAVNAMFLDIFTLEAGQKFDMPDYDYDGLAHPEPVPIMSTILFPFRDERLSNEYIYTITQANFVVTNIVNAANESAPYYMEWRFKQFSNYTTTIADVHDHVLDAANAQYLLYFVLAILIIIITYIVFAAFAIGAYKILARLNVVIHVCSSYLEITRIVDDEMPPSEVVPALEVLPCPLLGEDSDGNICYENEAAKCLFGELEGKSARTIDTNFIDGEGNQRCLAISKHVPSQFGFPSISTRSLVVVYDMTNFEHSTMRRNDLDIELKVMQALPSQMGGSRVIYLHRSIIVTIAAPIAEDIYLDSIKSVIQLGVGDFECLLTHSARPTGIFAVFNPLIIGKVQQKYVREAVGFTRLIMSALAELGIAGRASIVPGGEMVCAAIGEERPSLCIMSSSIILGSNLIRDIEPGQIVAEASSVKSISADLTVTNRNKVQWQNRYIEVITI